MIRYLAALIASVLLIGTAQAQGPGGFRPGGFQPGGLQPGYRPAVSPYLNLRLGGDPGLNYYGLVRPQVLANKTFQALGNDINSLEATNDNANLVQTGHASSFMTQGRYFMNNGASSPFRRGMGAGQQALQGQQAQQAPTGRR